MTSSSKMAKVSGRNDSVMTDPGGARRGNFINYYQFNPPTERLAHLPKDLLSTFQTDGDVFLALDVGCNSGDLTVALHDHLSPEARRELKVLGIDFDSDLVSVAQDKHGCKGSGDYVEFATLDVVKAMEEQDHSIFQSFLSQYEATKFDVAFCFSVTMWIHLNHGDQGLKSFICYLSKFCNYLVLEPQPWKCYRSASRRMRKLNQPDFDIEGTIASDSQETLMDFIDKVCADHGFRKIRVLGETSAWKRKIILYEKI